MENLVSSLIMMCMRMISLFVTEVVGFGRSVEVGVAKLDGEEGGGLGVKIVEGASVVIELITNDS